ncbi:hypothetical protein MF1_10800 [Bartonella quintana]|nr:hypothetical protein MF1_10800 [Bartonella quintana]
MIAADVLASEELVFGEMVGGETGCRGVESKAKSMRKDGSVERRLEMYDE